MVGVSFHASTRREAQRLGITGYARNLRDGNVEVLVCGEASAVAVLKEWLWTGPPAARVSNVVCQSADEPEPDRFRTA